MIEGIIEERTMKIWQNIWISISECRHTKEVIGTGKPKPWFTKELLSKPRSKIKIATEAITGHAHLNSRLNKMGLYPTPICDLCSNSQGGVNQTPLHLYKKCPTLKDDHIRIIGRDDRNDKEINIKNYMKFFEDKNIRVISKWDAEAAWLYESEEDYHLRMTGGLDMYDMYEEREEKNIYVPETNKETRKGNIK